MIIKRNISDTSGLTLIELIITTSIMSVLVFTVGYAFVIGLKLSNEGYTRAGVNTNIAQALELMSNSLRLAESIDTLTAGSITFTADLRGSGSEDNRFYLYNASDSEPNPPYTQNTYELRWAQGTVTYGSGAVLVTDIEKPNPPSSKPFSQSGNLITMDFAVNSGDGTLDIRSNVRVRNL